MAKCSICGTKIQETFMKKMIGTVVKDEKGKKHIVCNACQQKFSNDKAEMLKAKK